MPDMDLKSPPNIVEIPVTFIDIAYVGGIPDSITLREEDKLEILAENIVVYVAALSETIYVERRNVLSFRVRKGVIKRLLPPERPTPILPSDPPPGT